MNNERKKIYINFDPTEGYPVEENLYYECQNCASIICSMPNDSLSCECGNIRIDVHYGRLAMRNNELMRLFYFE
jgi:hypothetical protein